MRRFLGDLVSGRLNEAPRERFERARSEDRRYYIGLRERGVITEDQLQYELRFNETTHEVMWKIWNREISESQAEALMSQFSADHCSLCGSNSRRRG